MAFRDKIRSAHPLWKGVIWLLIMAILFVVVMASYILWLRFSGAQTVLQLKLTQLFQSVMLFVVPPFLAVCCWSNHPFQWLGFRKVGNWKLYAIVALLMVVAQPGINLIAAANEAIPHFYAPLEEVLKRMEENARETTELLASAPTIGALFLNLFVMAFIPALGEEISFRGLCQGLLTNDRETQLSARLSLPARMHMAIIITGAIFSFIHLQFYGFIPRMLLGMLLGYLLVWTGSIWMPIFAHFCNNAFVVCVYFLEENTTINADSIDNFGTGNTVWAGILSLVVVGLIIYLLRSVVRSQSAKPHLEDIAES